MAGAARVRVPATSANLGPAFDSAGLALTCHDVLEFTVAPAGLAVEVAGVGVVNRPLASVRKYNASWFRDRAEVVVNALEYLLAQHPEIATSRHGHARVLGQIAFARSTMGQQAATKSRSPVLRW